MKFILLIFGLQVVLLSPQERRLEFESDNKGAPSLFDQTPERHQIIKMQNRYHYDEDLTNELVNRNRRKYITKSIGELIDGLKTTFDKMKVKFQAKMEGLTTIADQKPEAIENKIVNNRI